MLKENPEKPEYKNISNSFLSHSIFLLSTKDVFYFLYFNKIKKQKTKKKRKEKTFPK